MKNASLVTSDSAVFKKVGNEIVVVHLATGQMLHFTPGTQSLLEFFESPRTLDQYLSAAGIDGNEAETIYLRNFVAFLQEHGILESAETAEDSLAATIAYVRPAFVKRNEKTLDQVAFLYP